MILSTDIIDRLPFELQARLAADEFFTDIPVVVAEEGNVALTLAQKQAVITSKGGKRGAAVIVLQVVADDDFPNLQFGPMTLYPAFQVVENLELNRDPHGTGKSARKIARRVRDVVKCAGMIGLVKDMRADKPCIAPVSLGEKLGDLVKSYTVNFRCLEVSAETMQQVQTPQITAVGGMFSIACATAGAAVYYTTDDSYPRPGNGTLYSAPVAVPAGGVTVRVCGYASGCMASWVNRAVISH